MHTLTRQGERYLLSWSHEPIVDAASAARVGLAAVRHAERCARSTPSVGNVVWVVPPTMGRIHARTSSWESPKDRTRALTLQVQARLLFGGIAYEVSRLLHVTNSSINGMLCRRVPVPLLVCSTAKALVYEL